MFWRRASPSEIISVKFKAGGVIGAIVAAGVAATVTVAVATAGAAEEAGANALKAWRLA